MILFLNACAVFEVATLQSAKGTSFIWYDTWRPVVLLGDLLHNFITNFESETKTKCMEK